MTRRFLLLFLLLSGLAFAQNRVYELRTYTCYDGKLEALKARFRDHTIAIFKRHGMESIGYWVPQDPEKSKNTLIYILAHPSLEAARKNWAAFQRRSRMGEGQGGLRSRRPHRAEDRIGLHGSHGVLNAQIAARLGHQLHARFRARPSSLALEATGA